MFFGSVCSGIEAASVAWKQIGWKASWLAEIEPFPSEVLKHHYPEVPNLGDMTKIADKVKASEVAAPDVLVGGTPCQAFSVAGMREGLADPRGELTIRYVELADAIDDVRRKRGEQPAVIVWENVPGVLSSKDNAFGCFLGALAGEDSELQPAGKKWGNAGCVYGPKRAIAWRVLDAQYFGLAQRRNRVFLVASARDGFDPAKVLFEFDSVRRDSAPSRETGQETAGGSGASLKTASHWDGLSNPHPTLSQSHNTGGIGASNQELFSQRGSGLVAQGYRMVAFGEYADDDSASTMKARDYKDATDLVCTPGSHHGSHHGSRHGSRAVVVHGTQDPIVSTEHAHALGRNGGQENAILHGGCLTSGHPQRARVYGVGGVSPTLQAEEGRGHGVPAVLTEAKSYGIPGNWIGRKPENGGNAVEPMHDIVGALDTQHGGQKLTDQKVATRDVSPTLTCNYGKQVDSSDSSLGPNVIFQEMRVRRLTPIECERLQGFPDNYTQIEWRGKPAEECPDGHRYKALGNSMAVPCMAWIGKRIQNLIEEQSWHAKLTTMKRKGLTPSKARGCQLASDYRSQV